MVQIAASTAVSYARRMTSDREILPDEARTIVERWALSRFDVERVENPVGLGLYRVSPGTDVVFRITEREAMQVGGDRFLAVSRRTGGVRAFTIDK